MPEELQNCVSCGEQVPESQDHPYPGHARHCALVLDWIRNSESRMIAAYLLDRADQYDTESPCWIALSDAAYNIMAGDVKEAWDHGELEDPALLSRVDGFKRLEDAIRPVDPKLGIDEDI